MGEDEGGRADLAEEEEGGSEGAGQESVDEWAIGDREGGSEEQLSNNEEKKVLLGNW